MESFLDEWKKCPLFTGMSGPDIIDAIDFLKAKGVSYRDGQTVFAEGEPAEYLGVVISGRVQIWKKDYEGKEFLLTVVEPFQVFGEDFACLDGQKTETRVTAAGHCEILLLQARRLLTPRRADEHGAVIDTILFNLIKMMARKKISLARRLEVVSRKSTEEKLLTYLQQQAEEAGSRSFTIPFNRQELADFLCVERCGLSSVIGRLQAQGVIHCRRSDFVLLKGDGTEKTEETGH